MIRPIDIRLNAAHPDLPLAEAVTYTGAPSTVLIRGVPGNCGRWAITAVFVAVTFPDGSTSTRTAVQSANGVWVATLPATATSGRTAHGLRILADGADENGEAVGGYVLGVADFAVASLGISPAPEPGETSWQMLYFDAVPGVLRKGDVTKVDGALKLYNGTAWEAFAPSPSTSAPLMDGTAAPGTSAAFARGDHVHPTDTSRMAATNTGADIAVSGTDATKIDAALAGKATKDDATLTPIYGGNGEKYGAWTINPSTYDGKTIEIVYHADGFWVPRYTGSDTDRGQGIDDPTGDMTSLTWDGDPYHWVGVDDGTTPLTATRVANPILGYTLGSQTDKPLASESEAEALRTAVNGKYAKPSGGIPKSDLASGVQSSLDKADAALPKSGGLMANDINFNASGDGVAFNKVANNWGRIAYNEPTDEIVVEYIVEDEEDPRVVRIPRLAGTLALLQNIAPTFSTSATYALNALCVYEGVLYRCTTAVTTAGAWTGSTNWTAATVEDVLAALSTGKANRASNPTAGNLAALDAKGNPTDAGWTAGDLARYSLASKTITNGAVTLDDRAINSVAVSSTLASLTINFPTATSGKVRDFGLRLSVASGITTAPELVLPQGITCENADGEVPEIGADGAATILYFTETAAGVFLVKGEVVTAIS